MSIEVMKLAAEFNRYFTSANGVDVPAKVSVSRDEWRALFDALSQQPATGEPVARVDYSERGNIAWLFGPQLPDGTELFKRPAPSVPATSVPVVVQHRKPVIGWKGETIGYTGWRDGKGLDGWPHRDLYDHPAPRVPDSIDPPAEDGTEYDYCSGQAAGYAEGWNACRAAMLAAKEPS